MGEALPIIFVAVFVVLLIVVALKFARYPGKIAAQRNHPNKDAIMLLGQFGILTFGVLWVVALAWAHSNFAATNAFLPSTDGFSGSRPTRADPATVTNVADEIAKLAQLRDQGILTAVEFEKRKAALLGR